jgi:membrane-associated phospholipid phosphatase
VLVWEWIVLVDLAYLAVLTAVRPMTRQRRVRFLAVAVPLAAAVVAVASLPQGPWLRHFRVWWPLVSALVCYWLAGLLFTSPQAAVEARFVALDRRLRATTGAATLAATGPRLALEFFEGAYFAGYLVPPAGMAVLVLAGRPDLADRFWSTLLLAILGCYAILPWVRTRPPWDIQPNPALTPRVVVLRRLNLFFVRTASTRANTFPSGHTAGAFAAALAVAPVAPVAGVVLFVVALSVAVGTVVGDYHYIVDAIAGAAMALLASGIVTLAGV